MTRGLSATNTTQVDGAHVHTVVLVKLEFDTPVYVHSGVGNIVYDSNTYTGVGDFGGVTQPRESEALGPSSVTLTLSGITGQNLTEALDSGNLYDVVTIYQGYRQDDGTLYDDPWIAWRGWYEYGSINMDDESSVHITCQHDLSRLTEKNGARYSDEDQQSKYTGDVGLEFVADMASVKLLWGGGPVGGAGGGTGQSELQPRNTSK